MASGSITILTGVIIYTYSIILALPPIALICVQLLNSTSNQITEHKWDVTKHLHTTEQNLSNHVMFDAKKCRKLHKSSMSLNKAKSVSLHLEQK
jgi:hypothetical protein